MNTIKKFKDAYIKYDLFVRELQKILKKANDWIIKYDLMIMLKLESERTPDESYRESLKELLTLCNPTIKEKQTNQEMFNKYIEYVNKGDIDQDKLNEIENITEALKEKTNSIKDFLEKLMIMMN